MLETEEQKRITIQEICSELLNSKYAGLNSGRTSTVHSIAEEYRDYYGDFDNEMVRNFEENQWNNSNNNIINNGNNINNKFFSKKNHHIYNHESSYGNEPFKEISPYEKNEKFRKKEHGFGVDLAGGGSFRGRERYNYNDNNAYSRKNEEIMGYQNQHQIENFNYQNTYNNFNSSHLGQNHNSGRKEKNTFNLKNFDFSKQSSPQNPKNPGYQHQEYGYYQEKPQNQGQKNINYNYEEPIRIRKKPTSNSKNVLSGGFRLSSTMEDQKGLKDVN